MINLNKEKLKEIYNSEPIQNEIEKYKIKDLNINRERSYWFRVWDIASYTCNQTKTTKVGIIVWTDFSDNNSVAIVILKNFNSIDFTDFELQMEVASSLDLEIKIEDLIQF